MNILVPSVWPSLQLLELEVQDGMRCLSIPVTQTRGHIDRKISSRPQEDSKSIAGFKSVGLPCAR